MQSNYTGNGNGVRTLSLSLSYAGRGAANEGSRWGWALTPQGRGTNTRANTRTHFYTHIYIFTHTLSHTGTHTHPHKQTTNQVGYLIGCSPLCGCVHVCPNSLCLFPCPLPCLPLSNSVPACLLWVFKLVLLFCLLFFVSFIKKRWQPTRRSIESMFCSTLI